MNFRLNTDPHIQHKTKHKKHLCLLQMLTKTMAQDVRLLQQYTALLPVVRKLNNFSPIEISPFTPANF